MPTETGGNQFVEKSFRPQFSITLAEIYRLARRNTAPLRRKGYQLMGGVVLGAMISSACVGGLALPTESPATEPAESGPGKSDVDTATKEPTATVTPEPTAAPTPTADAYAGYEKIPLSQEFNDGQSFAYFKDDEVTIVDGAGVELTPNESGFYKVDGQFWAWNAEEGKMTPLFEAAEGQKVQKDAQSGWFTFLDEEGQVIGVYDPETGEKYVADDKGRVTVNNETFEWQEGAWMDAQARVDLIASKIKNAIVREFVIENGNEVKRNGELYARLKIEEIPELTRHYTFPWKYVYQSARYLGNPFAIDWQDTELGKVKIYGFEVAFYNPETKEWAAVPVLFMTNPPEVQESKYRQGPNMHIVLESTEKALSEFIFGERLEMVFQAEDNSERFSQEDLICYEGWCNYDDFILARAFGSQMCPEETIDWINGETDVRPKKAVFVQGLAQYE